MQLKYNHSVQQAALQLFSSHSIIATHTLLSFTVYLTTNESENREGNILTLAHTALFAFKIFKRLILLLVYFREVCSAINL